MKTPRCYFPFQPKLTAPVLVAAACALSAPLLKPAPVCAQVTAAPPSVAGANPLYMPTIDSTAVLFELRDVPVRQALEMLLMAARNQFSVDNKVSGFITMKAEQRSLRANLDVFCSSCSTPLQYKFENSVLFIGLKPSDTQSAATAIPTASAPLQAPTSVMDVPRRVAGVLLLKSGQSYAVLETGLPYGFNTRVSVVSINAEPGQPSMHVPSGVAGVPDFLLKGIDGTGVTLGEEDGTTIHVPLAGAVSH